MHTIRLTPDGDISFNTTRNLDLVDGKDKLIQDLKTWILDDSYDPSHPQMSPSPQSALHLNAEQGYDAIQNVASAILDRIRAYQAAQQATMVKQAWTATASASSTPWQVTTELLISDTPKISTIAKEGALFVTIRVPVHTGQEVVVPLAPIYYTTER